jgi:hypothetical protein
MSLSEFSRHARLSSLEPEQNEVKQTSVVNAALNKPARQSSLSPWSTEGEAANAVSGVFPDDFAFHTDLQDGPFWEVDLGDCLPVERIILHNRIGCERHRARRVRIEIASAPDAWELVHAGFAAFGAAGNGHPLELPIGGDLDARWVRISLDEREYLHLSQVEVLVKREKVAFSAFCAINKLAKLRSGRTLKPYELVGDENAGMARIVGLSINYSGRFGNLLHQYMNAILIAQRTGLTAIRFGSHELLDFKEAVTVRGIRLIPAHEPLPEDGLFLSGEFFNSDDFLPVLSPFMRFEPEDERACTAVVQTFILPHMLSGLPVQGESHPDDELTIHLRSGDIFSSDHPVTYGYRQPPLSFYKLVVERMIDQGIRRVRLVYEDRGNPCVDALEAWLDRKGLRTRVQCQSLRADMSALIDAPHLVFGHGTFGYAAARLSTSIKTLHYFAPELGGVYGFIETIEEAFEVTDDAGGYIKAFEYGKPFGPNDGWRNTPDMRETMLTYPVEFLKIRKLTREHAESKTVWPAFES